MRASAVCKAGSTGRRNTFSLTGLQALVQSFGGSSPSEGLAGPCIERVSNNCEYVRTVPRCQGLSGENLPVVGQLLGHRRHRTTAGYAHIADKHLIEAVEKVGILIAQANGTQ